MNNIEELKPCPFCGCEAHLLTNNGSFLVECSACLTDFLNGPVGIGWYRSENDAAADWNDRPGCRALIAQLEAAQSDIDKLKAWKKIAAGRYEKLEDMKFQLEKAEAELSASRKVVTLYDERLKKAENDSSFMSDEVNIKSNLISYYNNKMHIYLQRALEAEDKLSTAKEKLNNPVKLDKFWIEPAVFWRKDEPTMPVDEIIKAIKAAGFTVEGE